MRAVSYLKTHTALFIPSIGVLGDTLTPNGGSNKTIELFMTADKEGVYIEARGQTILVPYGNVVLAVVGPDSTPTAPAAAQALTNDSKTNRKSLQSA